MVFRCSKSQAAYMYKDKPRPKWQRYIVYIVGVFFIGILSWWILRDTTPIRFVDPSFEDLNSPRGELATSSQLEDVYWRVAIRQASLTLSEVCKTKEYSVLTHKNIIMGGSKMKESYIYLCNPIDDIQSVLNARTVVSGSAINKVRCIETYANITKQVERKYPFSLKYISTQTFSQRTRVVRNPEEACTWLHAIDIVESIWD